MAMNLDAMTQRDLRHMINDVGEHVWFYSANRTESNIEGDSSRDTYDSKRKERVIIQFNDEGFTIEKEGLVRQPAISMFSKKALNPVRNDVVVPTRNNRSYKIKKTTIRNSIAMSELTEWNR